MENKNFKKKGKEINVGIASDNFNPSNPHYILELYNIYSII